MYLILIATAFLGSAAFSLLLRRLDKNSRQVAQMKKASHFYEKNLNDLANQHCERIKDSILEYEMLVNQSHQAESQLRRNLDEYHQQMEEVRKESSLVDQLSSRLSEMAQSAREMGEQVNKMDEGLQRLTHAREEIEDIYAAIGELNHHLERQESKIETTLSETVERLVKETEERLRHLIEQARSAFEALKQDHRGFQEQLQEQGQVTEVLTENVSALSGRLKEKWDLEASKINERQNELERRFKGRIDTLEQGLSEIRKTAVESLQEEIARMRADLEDFNLQALSRRDEILNETKRMAEKVQEQVRLFQEKYLEVENRFVKSAEAHEKNIHGIIEGYDQKWAVIQNKKIEEINQKILLLEEEIEQFRNQERENLATEVLQIQEQLQKQARAIETKLEAQETEGIKNLRQMRQSEERDLQTAREDFQHLKNNLSQQGQELKSYIRSETEHATELIRNARHEEEAQIMQGLQELEQIRAEQRVWIDSAQEQLDKAMQLQKNLETEINKKKGGLDERFTTLLEKLGEQFIDHKQEAEEYFSGQVNDSQKQLFSLKEEMDTTTELHRELKGEINHSRQELEKKAAQLYTDLEEKIQTYKQKTSEQLGKEATKLEETLQANRESISQYFNRRKNELQESIETVAEELAEEREAATQKIAEEREAATQKIAEEREAAAQKIAEEREEAAQKIADEKEVTTQKIAEEREEAAQKIAEEREVTTQKIAEEREAIIQKIGEERENIDKEILHFIEKQQAWAKSGQEQLEKALQLQKELKTEMGAKRESIQKELVKQRSDLAEMLRQERQQIEDYFTEQRSEMKTKLEDVENRLQGDKESLDQYIAEQQSKIKMLLKNNSQSLDEYFTDKQAEVKAVFQKETEGLKQEMSEEREAAKEEILQALTEQQELYEHLRQAAHNFEKDLRNLISIDDIVEKVEKEINLLLQKKDDTLQEKISQTKAHLTERLSAFREEGEQHLLQVSSDFTDLKKEMEITSGSLREHHQEMQIFGERIKIVEKAGELADQLDETVEILSERLELARSESSHIDQYMQNFEAIRFNRKDIENELQILEGQRNRIGEAKKELELIHTKLEKIEEAETMARQIEKRVVEFNKFKQLLDQYFSRFGERQKFVENALSHIEIAQKKSNNAGEAARELLTQVERARHRQEHLNNHLQQLESRSSNLANMERNIQQVEARFQQMDGLMLDLSEKQKQVGFMSRRMDEIKALEGNAFEELDSMLQETDEKMEKLSALYQTVEKLIDLGAQKAMDDQTTEVALVRQRGGKKQNTTLPEYKRDGILSLHLNHKWDEELIAQHLKLDPSLVRAVIASYKTVKSS